MRMLRTGVAGLCLATAVTLAVQAPAGAAPTSDSSSASIGSGLVPVFDAKQGTAKMVTPAAAATIITDFWTPSRIASASATPASVPAPAPDSLARTHKKPSGPPSAVTAPAPARTDPIRPLVAFTHTEGKVLFRDPRDGRLHGCSGGAINSGKRRLVLTAGHCVHGGPGGQWMQNWVFLPGYQFGQGPAGEFPAFQLWAKNGWINNADTHFDYAFAITQNNQFGQRLVDRVGGNGLIVNPGRPFITFIGYPDNVSNAEQQAFCQGQLSRRNIFNSDQKLNCNLGHGASGGPWLKDYSDANGLGWAVSNTSYAINTPPAGPVFGPYYDGDTTSLFNAAENASP